MSGWPLSALLTVATETPHSCARSFKDDISPPPSEGLSCHCLPQVLNRFRKFNIAHSALKIKRKRITFISIDAFSAICRAFSFRNYAVCPVFVTFRYRSIKVSLHERFMGRKWPVLFRCIFQESPCFLPKDRLLSRQRSPCLPLSRKALIVFANLWFRRFRFFAKEEQGYEIRTF